MQAEIALGIINVAGQAPQPAAANAGPEQRARRRQEQPRDHQKFAQFVHGLNMACPAAEGNEKLGLE